MELVAETRATPQPTTAHQIVFTTEDKCFLGREITQMSDLRSHKIHLFTLFVHLHQSIFLRQATGISCTEIQASPNFLPATEVNLILETSPEPGKLLFTPLSCHQSTPYSKSAPAKGVPPPFTPPSTPGTRTGGTPSPALYLEPQGPLHTLVPAQDGSPGAKRRNGCRWVGRAQPPALPALGQLMALMWSTWSS